MKKLLAFCLLMFTGTASASPPNGFSLSGGVGSLGSDVGYVAAITSPYIDSRTAFQFGYGYHIFNGMNKKQEFQDFGYSALTFSTLYRLYHVNNFSAYFRSGFFIVPRNVLTHQTNFGLNFAVGTEFVAYESLTVYAEAGWAFPIVARATALLDQPFARGASVQVGMKLYLF